MIDMFLFMSHRKIKEKIKYKSNNGFEFYLLF